MSNFNIKEIQKEKFYQLPKVFFTNPKYTKLSNDAKITWSILRDRLDLSIRNNWVDKNGDIFFIYTNEKLKSILNISSPNKLSKIKKELTQADLFNQIRVGLKENLDVSLYANPEFNWKQMEQIRLDLKDNLDVSKYAKLEYNWQQMKEIREKLENEQKNI